MEFLHERKNSGILSNDWAELEELYVKKWVNFWVKDKFFFWKIPKMMLFLRLWHQLTLKVQEIIQKPELRQGTMLIDVTLHFC